MTETCVQRSAGQRGTPVARASDQMTEFGMPLEDLEFLMRTSLLRATPDEAKRRLLTSLHRVKVKSGRRFISQGDKGEMLFIIQEGSCVVSLDANGQSHPLARLKRGDIVGEMAILTGENQGASVDAETEMVMWGVSMEAFEQLHQGCPEVRQFLTDLATERLCSQKITAERAIGRYTINEVLAEGGWSLVYKGVHSLLSFPVAIKMLKHNMALDSDMSKRFHNEAAVIAKLNHENIVRVYDIEQVFNTSFIIMEYLDGVTLKHLLENRLRLAFPRLLQILMQVCRGLDYAHHQGIVHQDIKPGNIFIQRNNCVKLVDFGLACPIGVCSDEMPGTAFYMAPEQIEGEAVDPRTDIYSLGIMAYEMATGRRPYPDDVCEALKAHMTEPTPDPRLFNPDLPEAFCGFVARATMKEPASRYRNLGEVLTVLEALAVRTGTDTRRKTKSRRRMMTLFMFYDYDQQLELNQLLEELSEELKRLGADFKVADFEDV